MVMNKLSVLDPTVLVKAKKEFDISSSSNSCNMNNVIMDVFNSGGAIENIGNYFEQSLERVERKGRGQYYTPKPIVEYIISQLDINEKSKILDPACGCGSFLLTLFDICHKKYGQKFLKNIYGVDINNEAVKMTRFCLYTKASFVDRYIEVLKSNIRIGDSLVSQSQIGKESFDWYAEFNQVMKDGGFDFIIGNPPYVTLRKYKDFEPSESIYKEIIDGPVNAATLMIGRSLEMLKEGGVLAFLLPKSILYVDSYKKLRHYLCINTNVLQVFDLGSKFKGVRGEQFILIVKKKKPSIKNNVKIRTFQYKERYLRTQPFIILPQNKFKKLGKLLTFDDIGYYSFIEKLSSCGVKLENYVNGKIFRGLPIGGNHTKSKKLDVYDTEVIRGRDISKFQIKSLNVIDQKLLLKQSSKKIKNLRSKKIVIQNIFSSEAGVIAAYDRKGLISLDTVTNISVKDEVEGKYLLALLNSKLLNFYLIYGIFNRSKLTMHMDKSYIGLIPIVEKISKNKLNKLLAIVNELIVCKDKMMQNIGLRKIDEVVYDIYQLKERQINLVDKAVSRTISSRSLW
jgi:tRNA1(Val) A37 N6-methylase TrmN6